MNLGPTVPEDHPWGESYFDRLHNGTTEPPSLDDPAPAVTVLLLLAGAVLLIPALMLGGFNGFTIVGLTLVSAAIIILLIRLAWKAARHVHHR